jgi:hypothetical protein
MNLELFGKLSARFDAIASFGQVTIRQAIGWSRELSSTGRCRKAMRRLPEKRARWAGVAGILFAGFAPWFRRKLLQAKRLVPCRGAACGTP